MESDIRAQRSIVSCSTSTDLRHLLCPREGQVGFSVDKTAPPAPDPHTLEQCCLQKIDMRYIFTLCSQGKSEVPSLANAKSGLLPDPPIPTIPVY